MQETKPNPPRQNSLHPIPAVGVVCRRGDEVLLIRRARPPRQGDWSIPGGKVARGESLHDAALRELYEETGVRAQITSLIGVYEIIEPGFHYVLIDYTAKWISREPVAGDDAAQARFMSREEALGHLAHNDLQDAIRKAYR